MEMDNSTGGIKMKVAAIMYSNNQYFYNKRETIVTTTKTQVVNEDTKIIQTADDVAYRNNTQSNSAEYVKHAYEVSFRPLDMIVNLQ